MIGIAIVALVLQGVLAIDNSKLIFWICVKLANGQYRNLFLMLHT